jgi:NAD(P)-dependent dehydrogenase (short-subunit alcohol dehydrogenase family)
MIRKQFDLSGKVALVIGGRGFLGRRFCAAMVEFGAKVYAADLPDISLAAKHDPSAVSGENVSQLDVDVTNPVSVKDLVEKVVNEAGTIDVLVYSVTTKPKDFYLPFTECSLDGWRFLLNTELDGLFLVSQQVGKVMEANRRGSIIFLSSIYGVVGNDQRIYLDSNLSELYTESAGAPSKRVYSHIGYPAVKGAIISMTRYLAAYWGEYGIRVNCVSPGGLAHPGENEAFVKRYSQRVPLGRKADLDEVSGAIIYLAADASSYVTGHNLLIDGGWTAW